LFTRAGIINFIDHKSQDLDLSWGPADVQLHICTLIESQASMRLQNDIAHLERRYL